MNTACIVNLGKFPNTPAGLGQTKEEKVCPSFRSEVTAVQFQQTVQNVQFKNVSITPLQPVQQGHAGTGGLRPPSASQQLQLSSGCWAGRDQTADKDFPGCFFHSLHIPRGAAAVESSALFLCSEHLLHAAITVLLLCAE